MSSLVQDQVEDPASTASTASTAMENRLDELIPRPAPAWQKVLGGALVLTLAVVGSLLWSFGYLVPMQTLQNGSSSERLTVSTHEGEPAVLVTKRIWNPTKRDVRMTDFVVDATGIDLVAVQARLEPESPEPEYGNCTTTGDTTTCVSLTPGIDCTRMQSNAGDTTEVCQVAHDQGYDPTVIPPDVTPLPLVIPAGRDAEVYFMFRPTTCTGPNEFPWGMMKPTFDFGDGAFPPIARTITLHGYLVDDAASVQQISGMNTANSAGNEFLAVVCQALATPR